MRLSTKISVLSIFLLVLLVLNSYVSFRQAVSIGRELEAVVKQDILLLKTVHGIQVKQLKKAVLFERVNRIAEELTGSQIEVPRKKYLQDQIPFLEESFGRLADEGALDFIRIRGVLEESSSGAMARTDLKPYRQAQETLSGMEKANIQYDMVLRDILAWVKSGEYDVSLENLQNVQAKENILSRQLGSFINEINRFSDWRLVQVEARKQKAEKLLWGSSVGAFVLSLLIVIFLMRSITRPLDELSIAAQRIGSGDLSVGVRKFSDDEIGKVSDAFNVMIKKLREMRSTLQEKNRHLEKMLSLSNRQKKDLERLNREIDAVIHSISHDLRSPLTRLLGYSSVLEQELSGKLDGRAGQALDGVKRGSVQLNLMIDDLLKVTQMFRQGERQGPVDMKQIFDSAIRRLQPLIDERHAVIDIKAPLPVVTGDAVKLEEAAYHLLNNAIKFSSLDKDVSSCCEIGCRDTGEYFEFFVRDNGVGIAHEHHEEIFEMFSKVNEDNAFGGTGVGLNLVKRIIFDHCGRVWVESQEGKGSTFYFSIPKVTE